MGKIHIVVNGEYKDLSPRIVDLPSSFERSGIILYEGRNTVRLIDFGRVSLVVKKYKKLSGIKKIIYRFRSTKASRAYRNALVLLDYGIATPIPAGFIEKKDALGFVNDSFYICEFNPFPPLSDFFEKKEDFDHAVIKGFAHFAVELHRHGIIFNDLNRSNVLVDASDGTHPRFYLIDINRMVFVNPHSITLRQRFENLSRFCYHRPEMFRFFIEAYCRKLMDENLLQNVKASKTTVDTLVELAIKIKRRSDDKRRRLVKTKALLALKRIPSDRL